MMWANNSVYHGPMVCFLHITLSHYHNYANLSEGIELLKCLSDIFLSVSRVKSVPDLIIIIKAEGWHICHCLGLGHETMVCSVCLSIFLFLRNWVYYSNDKYRTKMKKLSSWSIYGVSVMNILTKEDYLKWGYMVMSCQCYNGKQNIIVYTIAHII